MGEEEVQLSYAKEEPCSRTLKVLHHITTLCTEPTHSTCLLLLQPRFLERHEIKKWPPWHFFDTSCGKRAMTLLCRASKCTYPRVFLMSLRRSVTSDRVAGYQEAAVPLKQAAFPVRMQSHSHGIPLTNKNLRNKTDAFSNHHWHLGGMNLAVN